MMDKPEIGIDYAALFSTQEETLEVYTQKQGLRIGIPKESDSSENRIPLTPDGAGFLLKNGHKIQIETQAGKNSGYSDKDYSEQGAEIIYNTEEIFQCPIVLKIHPPNSSELAWMKGNQVLISNLPIQKLDKSFFSILKRKKITAFAYELLKDTCDQNVLVRSMSEVVGQSIIPLCGDLLSSKNGGKGILLGGITGIPPAQILVLGSGTVAEYTTKAALGMGALVKVIDTDLHRLRRFTKLFPQPLFTSIFKPNILRECIEQADVVIGAVRGFHGRSPILVTEEDVQSMQEHSVIMDISIDRGGCIETSRVTSCKEPTFIKHGIIHYCVPNIASYFPRTSSIALSNVFAPLLIEVGEKGGFPSVFYHASHLKKSLYCYKGSSVNSYISEYFDLPFTDISLYFP